MKVKLLGKIFFAVLFPALIFSYGCAGKSRVTARGIFAPVAKIENSVDVDSRAFPDSVILYFYALDFNPDSAELVEVVRDRVDRIDFKAFRPTIPESLKKVIFVEDCSGSMLPSLARADRMIKSALRDFVNIDVALVRVGREIEVVVDSIPASQLARMDISALGYPSPRGTDLLGGLRTALELAGDRASAVVLITDGSVGYSTGMDSVGDEFARRDIPLVIIQLTGMENPVLKQVASVSRGFYSAGDISVSSALTSGWRLVYSPAVRDTDGAEHRVILRWGVQRRLASYKVPGHPKPVVVQVDSGGEVEPFVIPHRLVEGIRIPFEKPGNAKILPVARQVLDSVVAMLSSFPDTIPIKLRVDGYTCDLGTRQFNQDLSLRRAEVVVNYLRKHLPRRVECEIYAHGESDPLLPNISERNRRVNRRVEIRLIAPGEVKPAVENSAVLNGKS